MSTDDGATLLTSDGVGGLLSAAVTHAGGDLVAWALDHVDANPNQSTTATYSAIVDWPYGRRDELLGVSARAHGLSASDNRAEIFADGDREVAVWLYPNDPDLPGLARAAYPSSMVAVLNAYKALPDPIAPDQLDLAMVTYRPRRRAVLRASVRGGPTFFVKVLRERLFHDVSRRHKLLLDAGVPAPRIAAGTQDFLLVLEELPGRPLARAIFDPVRPCTAEQLIEVLDAMPPAVAELERRPPWSDAVDHYARMVGAAVPSEQERLDRIVARVRSGLDAIPPGDEPTHGDFHEGQVHVAGGGVVGILDVDTIGPGRRADDLACLIAHLSTIQRMNAEQEARVHGILRDWVPVFDERVDPVELRLRAAAVIISLATGPYRGQEPEWERETMRMVDSAEALVLQVS
ncbi:MAG TPA: phosphotransferase [Propionibacterium sp.]|nr:phosphotransferase [Propionibacterium sp.]